MPASRRARQTFSRWLKNLQLFAFWCWKPEFTSRVNSPDLCKILLVCWAQNPCVLCKTCLKLNSHNRPLWKFKFFNIWQLQIRKLSFNVNRVWWVYEPHQSRKRCGARCLTHLQAWRARILRSPPSCRHRKLPRTTQRQNNILKSMFFLEIDSRNCNGSKMMENGCAWWIHLWWVKNITPYTSWNILLHDCPARPTRYAWLYARYF